MSRGQSPPRRTEAPQPQVRRAWSRAPSRSRNGGLRAVGGSRARGCRRTEQSSGLRHRGVRYPSRTAARLRTTEWPSSKVVTSALARAKAVYEFSPDRIGDVKSPALEVAPRAAPRIKVRIPTNRPIRDWRREEFDCLVIAHPPPPLLRVLVRPRRPSDTPSFEHGEDCRVGAVDVRRALLLARSHRVHRPARRGVIC